MINSYAGAYFRGRSGQFGAVRSQGVCRKFDTIGQARRHLHECPPVSAPQPAIVPYLADQLMGFDILSAADKQGVLPDLMTGDDNLQYGRTIILPCSTLTSGTSAPIFRGTLLPWTPLAVNLTISTTTPLLPMLRPVQFMRMTPLLPLPPPHDVFRH
jgi:hypothetical protein